MILKKYNRKRFEECSKEWRINLFLFIFIFIFFSKYCDLRWYDFIFYFRYIFSHPFLSILHFCFNISVSSFLFQHCFFTFFFRNNIFTPFGYHHILSTTLFLFILLCNSTDFVWLLFSYSFILFKPGQFLYKNDTLLFYKKKKMRTKVETIHQKWNDYIEEFWFFVCFSISYLISIPFYLRKELS